MVPPTAARIGWALWAILLPQLVVAVANAQLVVGSHVAEHGVQGLRNPEDAQREAVEPIYETYTAKDPAIGDFIAAAERLGATN